MREEIMGWREGEACEEASLVEQLGREGNDGEEDFDDVLELSWAREIRRPASNARMERKNDQSAALRPEEGRKKAHPGQSSDMRKELSDTPGLASVPFCC